MVLINFLEPNKIPHYIHYLPQVLLPRLVKKLISVSTNQQSSNVNNYLPEFIKEVITLKVSNNLFFENAFFCLYLMGGCPKFRKIK